MGYLLGAHTTSRPQASRSSTRSTDRARSRNLRKNSAPVTRSRSARSALCAASVTANGALRQTPRLEGAPKDVSAHRQTTELSQTRTLERGSAVITLMVGAATSFPGVTYVNALDHIANLDPPRAISLRVGGRDRGPGTPAPSPDGEAPAGEDETTRATEADPATAREGQPTAEAAAAARRQTYAPIERPWPGRPAERQLVGASALAGFALALIGVAVGRWVSSTNRRDRSR